MWLYKNGIHGDDTIAKFLVDASTETITNNKHYPVDENHDSGFLIISLVVRWFGLGKLEIEQKYLRVNISVTI